MPELSYYIVDVFTEQPLAGNPLAVVMNTCGLSSERMQAIAREFNLSETTFVERRDAEIEAREGVRVRIFTTQEELNFAGHPTLGTASVLKLYAPETLINDKIVLAENVGPVPVRFERLGLHGTMTQRDPEFGATLDAAEIASMLGLDVKDLDAALVPQIVSTGTAFAIVLLRSVEPLARLRVNHDAAVPFLRERGARWFYVLAHEPEEKITEAQRFRARMQFYGGEDPATGSAAGCAISFLVKHGAVPPRRQVQLQQGIEMSRPSHLFLSANLVDDRVTDVQVGGSTVPVAAGQIFLP